MKKWIGFSLCILFKCYALSALTYQALPCYQARDQCRPVPGAFCPRCNLDDETYYRAMQCSGSTGYCWCVNTLTGAQTSEATRDPSELECGFEISPRL